MSCTLSVAVCLWLGFPAASLTPGATVTADKAVICKGSPVRAVSNATKAKVYKAYGIVNTKGYIVDHLIPLEIGGANVLANLWPQAIADGKRKDQLENAVHRLICAGTVAPADIQMSIAQDWQGAYRKWVAP